MTPTAVPPQILVIGYGNTLRGDDGIGYQVAEAVAAWQRPHLRSLPVHQLLPELAAAIADVDVVVFIDAAIVSHPSSPHITVESLIAARDATFRTHLITPQFLLGLSQRLYGAAPTAYLLTIPAIDFALGTTLSPLACRGKALALGICHDIFQRLNTDQKTCPLFSSQD
ncbi:hydrogenase maturation protease [Neosynechococcus sphagnicola]|uniref:hydrogenase maturation protease n=1 Tax=Neosynechococcus sphagnicola TaxID=1501145 RepID=UPI00056A01DB|nr:hydrogenase maturation protease [Neosynechococcus sphagnicola]